MNLHGIVSGCINAVNPFVPLALVVSTGYTTADDGEQVPSYDSFSVSGQIQPMSWKDLRQVEGINLNGTPQSIYLYGEADAIVRVKRKGGDLIVDSNNQTWLITLVTELWPDWCKVVATLQNGA